MDKSDLVQQIKKGDQAAFRELVETYQHMILTTAQGFVGNIEDASDVTQDVFLEIYRSIHSFREQSALSTWIYRITITRSLNHIQKNKRIISQSGDNQDLSTIRDDEILELSGSLSDNPQNQLEVADRKKIFLEALNSLPESQQIAFTLHHYEDLPYKDIARIMKKSVSSIEALIFRARRNLQKKLWVWYKKS